MADTNTSGHAIVRELVGRGGVAWTDGDFDLQRLLYDADCIENGVAVPPARERLQRSGQRAKDSPEGSIEGGECHGLRQKIVGPDPSDLDSPKVSQ